MFICKLNVAMNGPGNKCLYVSDSPSLLLLLLLLLLLILLLLLLFLASLSPPDVLDWSFWSPAVRVLSEDLGISEVFSKYVRCSQ